MNEYYNQLIAKRINMINQSLNERDLEKLELNIDVIKKKKKRKLTIKELDELKWIIEHLQKVPTDEKFQDYVLKKLKTFLIYGNIKLINKNSIVLTITSSSKTSILFIDINKNKIKSTLKNPDYQEEITWEKLNDYYYTYYKRAEEDISKNRNMQFHDIYETSEFHGFYNNKEAVTRITSKQNNYFKNTLDNSINRKGLGENNHKEVTYYYRTDGFIIKKHKKTYLNKKVGELLNYEQYQLSEDFNKNEKYLNPNGHYKNFDKKFYKPITRGKCKIKSIYQQQN